MHCIVTKMWTFIDKDDKKIYYVGYYIEYYKDDYNSLQHSNTFQTKVISENLKNISSSAKF